MKIAISSTIQKLDGQIDEVFGRCPYFIIVEIEDGKIEKTESLKNETTDQTSGAGISSAQLVADKKVEAVITGNVGPRAFDVLNQFGIKVYAGKGSIKEAIQHFISGELEEIK